MDFLTPEEAAELCRVSTQTVLNWIRAGRLPAVRLSPRVIRIPRVAFERFRQGEAGGSRQDGRSNRDNGQETGDRNGGSGVRPEAVERRPWQEVLAEYERHFGLCTMDALTLHDRGETPPLRSADDERLYEAWLGAARLAVAAGLLEVGAPAASHA